jgi:hypothetical protein
MVVEAVVLDREDGLHHPLRDRAQWDVAALFTPRGDERRDERRIERHLLGGLSGPRELDTIDERRLGRPGAPRAEDHPDHLSHVVAVAGNQHDRIPSDGEFARLLGPGPVRVPEVVQPLDNLRRRKRLPAPQLERTREDAGIGARGFPVQPRVNLRRKAAVEEDRQR